MGGGGGGRGRHPGASSKLGGREGSLLRLLQTRQKSALGRITATLVKRAPAPGIMHEHTCEHVQTCVSGHTALTSRQTHTDTNACPPYKDTTWPHTVPTAGSPWLGLGAGSLMGVPSPHPNPVDYSPTTPTSHPPVASLSLPLPHTHSQIHMHTVNSEN